MEKKTTIRDLRGERDDVEERLAVSERANEELQERIDELEDQLSGPAPHHPNPSVYDRLDGLRGES
jgi:chaperonin cofactor prefoldin